MTQSFDEFWDGLPPTVRSNSKEIARLAWEASQPEYRTLRMMYAGALGTLSECSVHVPEEVREQIERVFLDAVKTGRFTYSRTLDLLEIGVRDR